MRVYQDGQRWILFLHQEVLGFFNSVQNTFIRPPVIKRQQYKYFTDLSKTFLKQALPQNKPCIIY